MAVFAEGMKWNEFKELLRTSIDAKSKRTNAVSTKKKPPKKPTTTTADKTSTKSTIRKGNVGHTRNIKVGTLLKKPTTKRKTLLGG